MRDFTSFVWKSTLLIVLFSSNLARAEQCPEWATPDRPKIERTFLYWSGGPVNEGPRLDDTSYYYYRGALFEMPYGYQNPWSYTEFSEALNYEEYVSLVIRHPHLFGFDESKFEFNRDLLEEDLQSDSFGSRTFSFWMPSLRYVESNMKLGAPFRPCEAGRTRSSENDYVVQFRIWWPGALENGLTHVDELISNSRRSSVVQYSDNDVLGQEVAVIPSCPNESMCSVRVWVKDKNLGLFLIFPERARKPGPDGLWREPLEAAVTLIESWKLERAPLSD